MNLPGLKRILLAEDSTLDAELTLAALEEFNLAHQVMVVRDGAEALDYLYHRGDFEHGIQPTPAVVILDVKMPRVNGLEVLRQIKSDPKLKAVPVVMLTSSREEQDLKDSYRLGVNAYVVKPVDFQKFLTSIQQLALFWTTINEPPPAPGETDPMEGTALD
ncbi:MAG TPA: response regulator [Candidatus Methylacidiphilales bacterium]